MRCTGRHLSFVSAESVGCAVQVSPVSGPVRPLGKGILMTDSGIQKTNTGPNKSKVIGYGLLSFFCPQLWFMVYVLIYLTPHPHITPNTPLFLALVVRFQAVSLPLLFLLPLLFVYSGWRFFREARRKPVVEQAPDSSSREESWPPTPKRLL